MGSRCFVTVKRETEGFITKRRAESGSRGADAPRFPREVSRIRFPWDSSHLNISSESIIGIRMASRTVGQGPQSLLNLASFPESFMRTYRERGAETGDNPPIRSDGRRPSTGWKRQLRGIGRGGMEAANQITRSSCAAPHGSASFFVHYEMNR